MTAIGHAVRFEMTGISKSFGATTALKDVNFKVNAGEICALVGQNGAGKSTLMSILSGAAQPDAGAMMLDGVAYRPRNPLEARQSGVAMIHQELSLASDLSVEENIVLGMEPTRYGIVRRAEMRARAKNVLRQLDHSEISPTMLAGTLSVAEQQLVEIARALAVGCRVLVLDEPTSSIARADVERLFEIIGRLKAQGHAVVYISHFIDEVKEVADRFAVLRDGRNAGGGDVRSATRKEIVEMMVGRSMEELYPRTRRRPGKVILDVAPGIELHRGEVLGIAGLVGAGRTRLLRRLFGRQSPWMHSVGMVSEDRKGEGLAMGMSVTDNLTLPRLTGWVSPSKQSSIAQRWIQDLEIRCHDDRQEISELSGGNQQKVALGRLLYCDVDVLLLDEPTRGIDVGSKAQIYELIDNLVAGGKAVLIVSSYFPELIGICDRIAVMHRGKLSAPRPVSEVDEHQLMMEACSGGRE
ncbi:MAG TPA: sugar ABC transporter ATP-binding protein [Terriglobia bacterium]|nr:sugar ABC transporter ATP-binding protein [Terriglobia bacterium]